ncbi:MAG: type II toxin-antitoxin system VapC family toxin [Imperialibacter sp.]|uniref:type II toxin-antitoxin system VapC family toxin n=1 Tax=Imperialibacter sp. TaxID=2038411 RepID=UPI0030DC786B|tara:strand:+ start:854 stop:1270 length:417 start_codon:yes stop_codon:yes gene_type:complete
MNSVLLDSDVLLDFFFDRQPFSEHAAQVLVLCESGQIKGHITPVIFSNTYYLLRQTASHDMTVEKLSTLMSILDVLAIDKDVIKNALASGFSDLEDALQNFSAIKSGIINIILTRNTKDYKKSELLVMTPEQYLRMVA